MSRLAGFAALSAVFLVQGCGGGGEAASVPTASVEFVTDATRTAFGDGIVGFRIQPGPAATEQVVCTVNGQAAADCQHAGTDGSVEFRGLAAGSHRLAVEVRKANAAGTVVTRAEHPLQVVDAAIVIFGATPAGIAAAIGAARSGQSVALIEPSPWVGGMMSGGLGKTDVGRKGAAIVGGLTGEFFGRLRAAHEASGACSAETPCEGAYEFEPQLAERLFERLLAEEPRIALERSAALTSVVKDGARIVRIGTSRGSISGRVFIDASYEGDLMARAGIPYVIGREARRVAEPPTDAAQLAVQEDDAGTSKVKPPYGVLRVDPYVVPRDPASGVLPFIEPPGLTPVEGSADSRVMAYTYRLCVTNDPSNRVPFARPAGYSAASYEASARVAQAMVAMGDDPGRVFFNPARTVRSTDRDYFKHDLNGGSTFSSDMTAPDLNQAYAEADAAGRKRIRLAYRNYVEGLLYTWQTDPRFGSLNAKVASFGLCRDEFTDRGNWPHQLYVRVSRRMVGSYVMNQNDVTRNGRRPQVADSIGMGAYDMDHHSFRYRVAPISWPGEAERRDAIVGEGFRIVRLPNDRPYPVPYRALTPKPEHAVNLLNPVTLSATSVAYSSLRMEPTYMILGQSAGIAAALAAERNADVQALPYDELARRLLQAGQVLAD